MNHAILPPSSAGCWVKCTGWVTMSSLYPEDTEGEAAREGTAVHELCFKLLEGYDRELIDTISSNGIVFDEDMYWGAKMYTGHIESIINEYPNFQAEFESRVEMPHIHQYNWGTPDAVWVNPHHKEIHIWDFKWGYGVVEAFENWQLLDYLNGVMLKYGINGAEDQHYTVYLHIVQPRAHHRDGQIRTWRFKAAEARGYFNILANAASKALSGSSECNSGDHCHYCRARHACPAALKAGITLFEAVSQPIPIELSSDELGVVYNILLRAEKQIEYLRSGFEAQIQARLKAGQPVLGWELANGYGRTKWSKPLDEIFALGDLMALNLRKDTEAITPAQAKTLGLDKELVEAYSITPITGLKLVKNNQNKAKEVFLT